MLQILSLLALGFVFGLKHAFDADHIAAVSVLVQPKALSRGIYWGIGHTFTLLIIGFLILVLGMQIPVRFSLFFEYIVGAVLIGLGGVALKDFLKSRVVTKEHIIHEHPPAGLHVHNRVSFFIGMLHGLAGSASVLVLIVSTIKSAMLGLLYILIFGIGSITGMGVLSLAIGISALFLKRYVALAASIFSLGAGVVIFVDTLLS